MGSHTWLVEPEVQDLISKMKMLYDTKKRAIPKSSKIKNWEEAGIMYNHALKKIHDYPRIKRVHGN
jgi:hypothetical protein